MKKILLFLILLFPSFVYADDNIGKIFKIVSYEYNELTESFLPIQYGSSVYVGDNLLYTNAHVILDKNNNPTGNYEICKTIDFMEIPECFSAGQLVYYDEKKDLAVLKIGSPGVSKINFSSKKLNVGDVVKVYGYPQSGGKTISYTEGKISGYEKGLYKIDANIDAGNSGGGVFDQDNNLVGIAVSVVVGYTTMGYIIPIIDIDDFKSKKNKNDIKEYNKLIDKQFNNYLKISQIVKKLDVFNNDYISVDSFKKYGFQIEHYLIDNKRNYFGLEVSNKNKDMYINIGNFNIMGNDNIHIDSLFNSDKQNLILSKKDKTIKNYKINKIKFKGKDTIVSYVELGDKGVYVSFTIEVNKNQYLSISILSDSIKNKEFSKGLQFILTGLNLKSVFKIDALNYSNFNNLQIQQFGNFYVLKNIGGDTLFSKGEDIYVEEGGVGVHKKDNFVEKTLSNMIKKNYNSSKEYVYYNEISIRQNSAGNYYIYVFYLNNKIKTLEEEKKNEKKYVIDIYYYDIKDDNNIYENYFRFAFDNIESKQLIELFLDNLKTNSNKTVVELGDLALNENFIKISEFDNEGNIIDNNIIKED